MYVCVFILGCIDHTGWPALMINHQKKEQENQLNGSIDKQINQTLSVAFSGTRLFFSRLNSCGLES